MNDWEPVLAAAVALAAAFLTFFGATRTAKTRHEATKLAVEIRQQLSGQERDDWDLVVERHITNEKSRVVGNIFSFAGGLALLGSSLVILAGYVGGYATVDVAAARQSVSAVMLFCAAVFILSALVLGGAGAYDKVRKVVGPWVRRRWPRVLSRRNHR